MDSTYIVLGLVLVVGFFFTVLYNRLVALRQSRNNAFADIDVQLRMRYDLIPNLVATVKQYAQHEKDVLENVTSARATAMQAKSIGDKGAAEAGLERALMNLLAVSENYPQLKADANFARFQEELSSIEKTIAAARRFFNNATSEYNTASQQFPASLVASLFGFKAETFFALDEQQKATMEEPPTVRF